MKDLRKCIVPAILLFAVIGFLAIITEMPSVYTAEGKYCNEGKSYFCWTSLPNWWCLTVSNTVFCVDPK